jgi:hypothetical protein
VHSELCSLKLTGLFGLLLSYFGVDGRIMVKAL